MSICFNKMRILHGPWLPYVCGSKIGEDRQAEAACSLQVEHGWFSKLGLTNLTDFISLVA